MYCRKFLSQNLQNDCNQQSVQHEQENVLNGKKNGLYKNSKRFHTQFEERKSKTVVSKYLLTWRLKII